MCWINTCWTWSFRGNCWASWTTWSFVCRCMWRRVCLTSVWGNWNVHDVNETQTDLPWSLEEQGMLHDVNTVSNRIFPKENLFVWRTRNDWCVKSIPAELEASVEIVHNVIADSNWVFFKENMFDCRTRNKWCLELIPAELGTVTETVHEVKADNTRVFFKESIVAWRTENIRCVELIPAGLEASAETEGTVDILGPLEVSASVMEVLRIVSCGRPCTCEPKNR